MPLHPVHSSTLLQKSQRWSAIITARWLLPTQLKIIITFDEIGSEPLWIPLLWPFPVVWMPLIRHKKLRIQANSRHNINRQSALPGSAIEFERRRTYLGWNFVLRNFSTRDEPLKIFPLPLPLRLSVKSFYRFIPVTMSVKSILYHIFSPLILPLKNINTSQVI